MKYSIENPNPLLNPTYVPLS